MKKNKKVIFGLIIIVVILVAFWLGWWLSHRGHMSHNMNTKQTSKIEKKPLYWVAPMDPNYKRDKPGKSPMGMDLVPVYDEPNKGGVIKISPTVENNIGVKTYIVKKEPLNQSIHTVGYVQTDENSIKDISVYSQGWVRDLQVQSTGEEVRKGQLLFKLYSPAVISAEEEYVLALKMKNALLIKSGREKLITLGVSEKDINQLQKSHRIQKEISFYSPDNGYVAKLDVREGMHVMPQNLVMKIANLATVWVIAEVYEKQSGIIKNGMLAEATFNSIPNHVFKGKVDYIYPELNDKTRTMRIRLVFNNSKALLKPKMYANITIDVPHKAPVIAIPKEALIQMGDKNKVILALGKGRFKPITVEIGQESDDLIEIKQGLNPGDKVVTSAQFLLDSESSIKAGLDRLDASDKADTNHQHHH